MVSVITLKIIMAAVVTAKIGSWLFSVIKNTLPMNPWWRWRLFADKYNNHLLYSMIAMMSCVQAVLVYKWYKGERIKRKWFHAVTGKLYNPLSKSSRPEACKNSFLSIYNSVRLKKKNTKKIFSRDESLNIDFRPEDKFAMPMSSEGGGKSNLFSAYKVSTADFEDFLYFLKLITFGLFINDLSKSNWSFLCFAMDRVSSCIFPWEFELFCVNQGQNLKMSAGLPTKIYSRSSYQGPTSQTKTVCTELVLFGHMWWHICDVIQ